MPQLTPARRARSKLGAAAGWRSWPRVSSASSPRHDAGVLGRLFLRASFRSAASATRRCGVPRSDEARLRRACALRRRRALLFFVLRETAAAIASDRFGTVPDHPLADLLTSGDRHGLLRLADGNRSATAWRGERGARACGRPFAAFCSTGRHFGTGGPRRLLPRPSPDHQRELGLRDPHRGAQAASSAGARSCRPSVHRGGRQYLLLFYVATREWVAPLSGLGCAIAGRSCWARGAAVAARERDHAPSRRMQEDDSAAVQHSRIIFVSSRGTIRFAARRLRRHRVFAGVADRRRAVALADPEDAGTR